MPIYAAAYGPSRALCISNLLETTKPLSDAVSDPKGFVYCLGAGSGAELAAIISHTSTSTSSATVNVQDLADNIPQLSKFTNDRPDLRVEYSVGDLLDEGNADLDVCIKKASLITASFLLNELLSTSKRGFVGLLGRLVKGMKSGALLMVIDSAGSFSEVGVSERSCMLFELLDKIAAFDIVEQDDARWYRHPKVLC